MRMTIFLIAACSTIGSALFAKTVDTTGVCFRRLSGLDRQGMVINRYEAVIVRSSSSVASDIARVTRVSGRGDPLSSPDMTANTWIGASISDTMFDGMSKENCSKLPVLRRAKP
ncbi:hypothetical protein U1872_10405 [Sphingomonas sp. RB3P16]|uniref:hypothetical protein n=1 Tax=Parasphingomonas frigoris TaxID=3096163 RepID=UPI002FC7310C